jgi:hypothetical protein
VSELVVQEVRAGEALLASQRLEILRDVPILPVSSDILKLAQDLIGEGPIPRKAADDAAHIAIATVYGCEYLMTGTAGYEMPSLCTPEELMGEEQ